MAKQRLKTARDVDYTIPGLVALVGIVIFTALFFAQNGNIAVLSSAGNAYYVVEGTGPENFGYNIGQGVDPGYNIGAGRNIGGEAIATVDVDAPSSCAVKSWCDGSKLVRQTGDCRQYVAFCQYGCDAQGDQAVCL